MLLDGKRTLVTGGSRGIGFQVSQIFLENGADVVAVSRDARRLAQARRDLPGLKTLQADVSVASDNDRVAAWVGDAWGSLDILVNNAGVSPKSDAVLVGQTDEAFEGTLRVNVVGPYLLTKRLLPLLLRSDAPRVVNIGSGMGVVDADLAGIYSVSKAALHALTLAMANELKGKVAVNVLMPGWVKTDMAPDGPGDPRTSAEAALFLVTQPHDVSGRLFRQKTEQNWT